MVPKLRLVLCLVLTLLQSEELMGTGCVQTGLCTCKFQDGSEIDLTPLGQQDGGALIRDVQVGDYQYSFNPCFPFNEGTCSNVSACQKYVKDSAYYDLGDYNTAKLTYDGMTIRGTYTASLDQYSQRTTMVDFICDPKATVLDTTAYGEVVFLTYRFSVTSVHACKNNILTTSSKPVTSTKPKHGCHTNYGDFIKRCEYSYDGHEEPVKVVFIRNWDGRCKFPLNRDVAVTLYSANSTCAGVTNRCSPRQPFSVNGEVCRKIIN